MVDRWSGATAVMEVATLVDEAEELSWGSDSMVARPPSKSEEKRGGAEGSGWVWTSVNGSARRLRGGKGGVIPKTTHGWYEIEQTKLPQPT